jgi:hypothetical protein
MLSGACNLKLFTAVINTDYSTLVQYLLAKIEPAQVEPLTGLHSIGRIILD